VSCLTGDFDEQRHGACIDHASSRAYPMSDASLPKNEIFNSEPISTQRQSSQRQANQRQTKRKGFWAALLEALHHSRCLEAQRVLRRYQHLIDSAAQHQRPSDIERIDDVAQ
jgi:hypothetical protein